VTEQPYALLEWREGSHALKHELHALAIFLKRFNYLKLPNSPNQIQK
jgi:hypothetical protein